MLSSKRVSRWVSLLLVGGLSFGLTACAKKQMVKKSVDDTEKISDGVETEELDIHGKDFESSKSAAWIYFEYDSSDLSEQARETLAQNAAYLKKNKAIEILVEGHCDERGTIGYNLALGQKRAQAVRRYYVSLGLDPKKVGTVSFGKEKPDCLDTSESCWSKNRRSETKVRAYRVADNGASQSK
ncbi:MAG: peptidoglycan-associated lipoprotein Pal [Elusimicrobia bacterium]|nr:peptidoglycan-associated lipoprotein Pal [Elusimicrobiota bacterium]MBI3013185.1 peptidoglycan-associated lipoprotein Pal [Elusimicrobiota bacterium]